MKIQTKFIRLAQACPICFGRESGCWKVENQSNVIHCKQDNAPDTWKKLQKDQLGFNQFVPLTTTYTKADYIASISTELNSAIAIPSDVKNLLFKRIIAENPITHFHRTQLLQRLKTPNLLPLVSDRLFSINAFSFDYPIAGVTTREDTKCWRQGNGFYIATKSVTDTLRDGQFRPDQIINNKKYLWGVSDTYEKRLPSGNLPYQFVNYCQGKPDHVVFCEGILKPIIAAAHFPWFAWVGFSGMNSTAQEVKEISGYIYSLGYSTAYLFPDAASFNNQHIIRQYEKLERLLKVNGITLRIIEWGQLHKKEALDCDEVDWFKSANSLPSDWLRQAEKTAPNKEATLLAYQSLITEDWLTLATTHGGKFQFINLPVGYGKSHQIGTILPPSEKTKIYYLSQQPDYPSTDTLRNWFRFPIRYNARHVSECGKYQVLEFKGNKASGNCKYAHLHRKLASYDLPQSICSSCNVKAKCATEAGPGYGFLYELKQLGFNQLIRSHYLSLRNCPDSYQLVIDEVKASLPPVIQKFISFTELFRLEQLLEFPRFYSFLEQIQRASNTNEFGLSSSQLYPEIKELFSLPTEALTGLLDKETQYGNAYINSLFTKSKLPPITPCLTEFLGVIEQTHVGFTTKLGFVFLHVNTLARKLIDNAEKIYLLDGTLSEEELRVFYGIKEDIKVYTAPLYTNNLKLTIIPDFPETINNQAKDTLSIKKLKLHLIGLGYKIVTWKAFSEEGDLTFLSSSRGSNEFESADKIALLGLPTINLGYLKEEYQLLNGAHYLSFSEYYKRNTLSELNQAIGRLRAERRQAKTLECLIVANIDKSDLSQYYVTKKMYKSLSIASILL